MTLIIRSIPLGQLAESRLRMESDFILGKGVGAKIHTFFCFILFLLNINT